MSPCRATAQEAPPLRTPLVYFGAGFGRDLLHQKSWSGGFGLSVVGRNGWGGSVQTRLGNFTSVNLPADYKGGFTLFGDASDPIDAYQTYSMHVVKEFFLPQKRLRYGLEAGPTIIRYEEEMFSPYIRTPASGMGINLGLGDKNYTHERVRREGYGVSFKAKAELPFSRITGFELSAAANINTQASMFGFELGWNIGRLRDPIERMGQ